MYVHLSKYCQKPAVWPQARHPLSLSLLPQLCNERLGSIISKEATGTYSPKSQPLPGRVRFSFILEFLAFSSHVTRQGEACWSIL